MKAKRVYGLISMMALFAVCASAFAQDGPPPQDERGGPPPMQGRGPEGGQMRRMGPPMVPLFMRPDVQKELKLSDEQVEKLRQLMPPPPMGGPDVMRGGPAGEGAPGGEMHERHGGPPQGDASRHGGEGGPGGARRMGGGPGGPDGIDKQLSEVLSDGQMKRLKQLRLQRQGALALIHKEIADKVGLSDDERQRIRGMIDEAMEPQRDMQDGPPDRKAMEAKHAQLNRDILESLSSRERAKWDELCGKPFKFDEKWHPEPPLGDLQRGRGGERGERGQGDPNEGAPPELQSGD